MEIKKPKLPPEEVLQFIERNRKITIARNGFASRAYYNSDHMEGKNHPVFHSNSGRGNHVPLVDIEGAIWVVLPFGGNISDPIIFNIPVRHRD